MSNKSRRDWLFSAGYGVSGLALNGLMPGGGVLSVPLAQAAPSYIDPLAKKEPHFAAKVKSVIWLHMDGAPSTLDLFDYKPELVRLAGQEVPESFRKGLQVTTSGGAGKLFASNRTWKQYGQSGAWFSDLLPNLGEHADKITFIKSSVTVGATHDISILKLNTGDVTPGRPSLGAWITYALGSANPDLPPYVVLYGGKREPRGGSVNWNSGFLPAVFQGTAFRPGASPILNLDRPELIAAAQQRDNLDLLAKLNAHKSEDFSADTELQARTRSYELAYRMESSAPEAVDLAKETAATKSLYGLDNEATKDYGTVLLRARRLVERGVRFVQVVSGPVDSINEDNKNWDAHRKLEENHGANARAVDKPIAGLLADLAARGLLDETLVVWTSEFGRTSYGQSGDGRDHNPWGYTQWLAGGGLKHGFTYGQTDEIGLKTVENPVDTYDLHATVLQLLGLDHLKTIYKRAGRAERPTVVYGKVVNDVLA
ncbi:DUF1501 domain-containing protein [Methylocystis iwaonis]|uniref:DUF1501 domain-containing protein n=1 Tax=Methylocystis iwaonis TaxID=2885079 RepID=A0ABN6VE00_9HYPH|nr:DUF1501 domain-containing protein [Methylocystis iwaonis]BDV33846.1 hypothetical protein SS37A_13750 [Methylocystis iwaonis]